MKLGEYIRQLREAKDISLREFAGRLNLTPAFISDIELGKRNPSKDVLNQMAEFFGVSTEDLAKYDERVPVDDTKKLMQTNPAAGAAVGVLLRKAVENRQVTQADIKKIMDAINPKKEE